MINLNWNEKITNAHCRDDKPKHNVGERGGQQISVLWHNVAKTDCCHSDETKVKGVHKAPTLPQLHQKSASGRVNWT